jgi:hypothetical protein
MIMRRWKEIAGHNGRYEVSDDGLVRVRHLLRVLKGWKAKDGRKKVLLRNGSGDTFHLISHLVAEAFIGPRPDGMILRHLDDDAGNDCVANLAYGTTKQNSDDAMRNGRLRKGESCHNAKLTGDRVREIRSLLASGMKQIDVSRQTGISYDCVKRVKLGKSWNHIE